MRFAAIITLFKANTPLDCYNYIIIKELNMSVPSKANIGKPDNPARLKINHQAGTEPVVS
jgi:hypothetical protein